MKRLYRTEGRDATICGVCGGIAEYFGIDLSCWLVDRKSVEPA